jgi:hypothetical protein
VLYRTCFRFFPAGFFAPPCPTMKTIANRRALREQIVALLQVPDFPALAALAGQEDGVAGHLMGFLFSPKELLHWRAVEGLGYVAAAWPEQVRKGINRLLWQLNEDSGSFGWLAAAALGEIGRHHLPLVAEILPMFCGFLENDFARMSMLWGIGRLWEVHPEALDEAVPLVLFLLQDPDPQLRGLAAWCLGKAGRPGAAEALRGLLADDGPGELYDKEGFCNTTVGGLAREALAGLEGKG